MSSQQKNFFIKCLEISLACFLCLVFTYFYALYAKQWKLSDNTNILEHPFYIILSSLLPVLISFMLRAFNEGPLHKDFWLIKVISTFKHALFVLASELILWHIFFDKAVNGLTLSFISFSFSMILFTLNQFIHFLFRFPLFRSNILIIGASEAGNEFACNFLDCRVHNTYLVGFIDDNLQSELYTFIESNRRGKVKIPILQSTLNLANLCKQYQITDIVISSDRTHSQDFMNEIFECRKTGINIHKSSTLSEKLFYKVPVLNVEEANSIFDGELYVESSYDILIRITNIIFASIGLLVYGIFIFPFVVILQQILMPGPIFYRQVRCGHLEKNFIIFKIRSMIVNAEKDGHTWAQADDDRIPTFGKIIRKFRIDEFPQFINVIKGDMNVIGPRPERPIIIQRLEKEIPYYRRRHLAKPGLTGWAQVNHPYGNTIEDSITKLEYDLFYIKNRSLSIDLYILLRTVATVIKMKGL